MATWTAGRSNTLTGYDPSTGRPGRVYRFDAAGSVDLGGLLRTQPGVPGINNDWRVAATVNITFSPLDHWYTGSQMGNNRVLSANYYFLPASALPGSGTPTPQQMFDTRNNPAALVYRSGTTVELVLNGDPGSPVYGNKVFDFPGPAFNYLSPNTKYWVMVLPVARLKTSSEPRNDLPLPNYTDNGQFVSNAPNVVGRAVSLWTNRPPKAPVIQSPANGTERTGNQSMPFTLLNEDPDYAGAGSYGGDISGVQIQISPQPSVSDPDPAWRDISVRGTAADGSSLRDGWYVMGSSRNPSGNNRLPSLLAQGVATTSIRLGSTGASANDIIVPSGKWRLRARVFDFGHPFRRELPPLNNSAATPNSFSTRNASPWSAPVSVSVLAAINTPTLIHPIQGTAVVEGDDVIFEWRHRSTTIPSLPQDAATLAVREAGASIWHIVTLSGPDSTYRFNSEYEGFPLVAGKQYEWRVFTSSGPETSDSSGIETFWVVPAPATPPFTLDEALDGSTLGCGTYRAFVYRRGGERRVGEVTGLETVQWKRTRDEISDASVVVKDWDIDCGNLLASLQTWAYELVLFRETAFGTDRVWEGPITSLTYERDRVTIDAKDVMAYAYRRIMRIGSPSGDAGSSVVSRAATLLRNAFVVDDPNVLAGVYPLYSGADATQKRKPADYSRTVYEEIDEMASYSGLDYTVSGRSILLWGTRNRVGLLPEFRDEHLGSVPIVSEYGMSFANRYVVTDGNGIWGGADRIDGDLNSDPVYGLVEVLSSTWSEEDEAGPADVVSAERRAEMIKGFEESAENTLSAKFPPPVVVRVPDNTTLSPEAPLSIQHLVPGVAVPLRSYSTLRKVAALQKLDSVSVRSDASGEKISIILSPFSRLDDGSDEEGGVE